MSIICLFIVIPYISIQLKALEFSFNFLHYGNASPFASIGEPVFFRDPTMLFVIVFALFAIFFGTIKLDPSEKHPGLVSMVALESIIKLVCFLIGSVAIIWFVFDGIGDVFSKYGDSYALEELAILSSTSVDYQSWFWVMVLSAFAFLLLPRQFHMAVVENNSARHLKHATWITPLYLLIISVLVVPVAFAGRILLSDTVEADTYLLSVPVLEHMELVAVIVFIGGLAAISGMIMTSMISLSIMISNNIFLPLLLKVNKQFHSVLGDLNTRLLQIRRVLIVLVMVLSYGFYKGFTINYSLVSVGLISFAGIAQLAPLVLFGIYWKSATERGAMAGLSVGTLIWAFTLPIANMAELGILSSELISEGLFGWDMLRPTALFGLEGISPIAHGTFWSLTANILVMVTVSFYSERSPLEIAQSDIFLNPAKYYKAENPTTSTLVREAIFADLENTLIDILGAPKVRKLMTKHFKSRNILEPPTIADSELISYLESHLSGSIGTASANIVLNKLVKQKPVDTQELIKILDQTYQVYEYSQQLEAKSRQLSRTTEELRQANSQLQELDAMKNEFISNVTHELRTPITSIRSIAGILNSYEVTDAEKSKFLSVIDQESARVAALVNQVLDLRKVEAMPEIRLAQFDLSELVEQVVYGFTELKAKRQISIDGPNVTVYSDRRRVQQIMVNLVSNAIKFTDPNKGKIHISWSVKDGKLKLSVKDNGIGILQKDLPKVFDRFYQVEQRNINKSSGSGLGLSISKTMADLLGGTLKVSSFERKGSTFILEIPIEHPDSI